MAIVYRSPSGNKTYRDENAGSFNDALGFPEVSHTPTATYYKGSYSNNTGSGAWTQTSIGTGGVTEHLCGTDTRTNNTVTLWTAVVYRPYYNLTMNSNIELGRKVYFEFSGVLNGTPNNIDIYAITPQIGSPSFNNLTGGSSIGSYDVTALGTQRFNTGITWSGTTIAVYMIMQGDVSSLLTFPMVANAHDLHEIKTPVPNFVTAL